MFRHSQNQALGVGGWVLGGGHSDGPDFPNSQPPTPNPQRRSGLRSGFTLVEVLVVMIILAILAAVVVPRVVGRTEDARRARAVSDVASLETALDLYKADNGDYPVRGRVCVPADLCATVYRCLGIDPEGEMSDQGGKPMPLARGEPISELF